MPTRDDALFKYAVAPEAASVEPSVTSAAWKLLSVEDDQSYQQALLYGLRGLLVQSLPVQILTANSAAKAAEMLMLHDDIAVILLDVVMEEDDSGLRLVETIRNVQGNEAVRIILLTGQPGSAPRESVMKEYDINEYWNKSEVQYDLLSTVIGAHIRTWKTLIELKQACIGLQMVVDAARNLNSKYDIDSFTQAILTEIGKVIGLSQEGIVCVSKKYSDSEHIKPVQPMIVAASGSSAHLRGKVFTQEIQDSFGNIGKKALMMRYHQFDKNNTALFFQGDNEISDYFLVLMKNNNNLSTYHVNLLKVFSENISSGFSNIILINRLSKLAYQDRTLKIHNRNWLQRELLSMNEIDKNCSELILIGINSFTTKALTFGEDHTNELIKQLYLAIKKMSSSLNVIIKVEADTLALLCHKNNSPSKSEMQGLIEQSVIINGIPHFLELTIINMDMKLLIDFTPERIFYLGYGVLNIAKKLGLSILDYNHEYLEQITSESILMYDLRDAIINNELYIALQPKVNLENKRVIGFEALLRWEQDGVQIPPSIFIPIAEKSGLINQLDKFVFRETVNVLITLKNAGYVLPISFNATCADLKDKNYIDSIILAVNNGEVDPKLLDIEITESQAMLDYEEINPILLQLRELGIKVSIDDFGTGYSSLAHIAQLAATTIKIDRTFVTHIGKDKASSHVVNMVVKMAKTFGFNVIAEGIETEKQRHTLLEHGCKNGQGFLFAKPMPISKLLSWLDNNDCEMD